MESADRLKQLLHDQYIRFLHVHEAYMDIEIEQLLDIAERRAITRLPRNITAIHVIDCIGRNEPINSTAIAEVMDLSKASITKIGSKLLEEGFVERTQLNDNKKESYFRLTPQGKQLFDLHTQLHQVEAERFCGFLDKYTDGELGVIRNFLQDYSMELERKLTEGV
ncbi:putative HTH-type transcriptional regulator YvmB [Paenibacillus albidus]|uniref:HTH-type transcriptional regulator YvmB n=1 Tax=Paenibacillus albidus TaxID=2041023 RepID=A0A917BWJ9_9BACL|nr:MarR family transcriptional regulator [Paenibacillus albidus]GGF59709.1 putative HTH-type transcriptional regulator YvmB [Paenibacillus albidus]